jgi:hypothetical protein
MNMTSNKKFPLPSNVLGTISLITLHVTAFVGFLMTVCLQIPAAFFLFLDFYECKLRNIAQLLTSVLGESLLPCLISSMQGGIESLHSNAAVPLGVVEDYHCMDGDKNGLLPHLAVPLGDVEHYGRRSPYRWAE